MLFPLKYYVSQGHILTNFYNCLFTGPSSVASNITHITVNESDRIYLWCFATGVPQPNITWYHKNEELKTNSYLTLTNPTVHQSALIILQSNRERDEGVYTCEAKNNVTNLINATQSHNITVNIQGIFPLFLAI